MKLKSFFANSIEEAIRLARLELGPDAMLVNSKRAGAEAQHLGLYEVVVASESETEPATGNRRPESGHRAMVNAGKARQHLSSAAGPVDQLAKDVCALKQRIENLALTLARSGCESRPFSPELSRVFTLLTDAELDSEITYNLVSNLSSPVTEAGLKSELAKVIRIDQKLGTGACHSQVVAFVGPPGAGKTSALVKLAVQNGIAAQKTVQVLTADTYRIAAAEELRCYAAILGIGCQVLESPAALAQAIQECRQKDLVLIDTPGLCRSEMDACEGLADLIATHPSVDTQLVLSASMRADDMRRVAERYRIFQPRKLLFTHMDETETVGPVLSISRQMGKPISFLSHGQGIPEDLEPATTDALVNLILGPVKADISKFDVVAA